MMTRTAPMRRTGFKRRQPARPAKQTDYVPAARPVVAPVAALPVTRPVPKDGRFESEAWRRAVAALPCVFCGRHGTQAAHRNEGKGMGMKADDSLTAALCAEHHAAIDQGMDMTREQRRSEIDRAIVLTVRELARRGVLIVRDRP